MVWSVPHIDIDQLCWTRYIQRYEEYSNFLFFCTIESSDGKRRFFRKYQRLHGPTPSPGFHTAGFLVRVVFRAAFVPLVSS